MGSLSEAFRKAEEQRKYDIFGQDLGAIIQQGLFPFHPGNIRLSLEQDFASFIRTLYVEIDAVRIYPFKYKLDERQLWQAYDPEHYVLESIREPLINHLRYRPTLPVDDHIVLGED